MPTSDQIAPLIRKHAPLLYACVVCLWLLPGCVRDNSPVAPGPTQTYNPFATTGPETIDLGRYYTSNWRSADFAGTSYREWSGDVDYFLYRFNVTAGDLCGFIGKNRDTTPNWSGTRLDALPNPLIMSANARMDELVGTDYMFAVYGWAHEQDVTWSGDGWNDEFYVVFQGRSVNATPGYTDTGAVTVDGVTFDCYKYPHAPWMGTAPNKTQWMAECRQRTWKPSVNLTPIFQHFRENGMANEYIVHLGWILEVIYGEVSGKLYLDRIVVPDLNQRQVPSR